MKKTAVSALFYILMSSFTFGMGTTTLIVTATAVVTAIPTPVAAGTLNPPELIYEDEKVKVEKVWENEFMGVKGIVWGKKKVEDTEKIRKSSAFIIEEDKSNNSVTIIYPEILGRGYPVRLLNEYGEVIKEFSDRSLASTKKEEFKKIVALRKEVDGGANIILVDADGGITWEITKERLGEIIHPLTKERFLETVSIPGMDITNFNIYSKGKERIEISYNSSDRDNSYNDINFSKYGEYIAICGGELPPEILLLNKNGTIIIEKKMPFTNYSCTYLKISAFGKYLITNYVNAKEQIRKIVLLDNQINILKEIDFDKLGKANFDFSDDESKGIILFLDNEVIQIYLLSLQEDVISNEFQISKYSGSKYIFKSKYKNILTNNGMEYFYIKKKKTKREIIKVGIKGEK